MTWWLPIVVGYLVVALAVLRPLAGHFAWSFWRNERDRYAYSARMERPNGDQWFGAVGLALGVGAVWPVAMVWLLADRWLPVVGAERIEQLEARERRIREAERELGL